MTIVTVGCDVSQAELAVHVHISDQDTRDLGTFDNTPAGLAALDEVLTTIQSEVKAGAIHLVAEPTGGYEMPLAQYAHDAGWRVSLPNPKRVRQWAQATGVRSKTDAVDARVLAAYGAALDLPAWQPLPEDVALLERLVYRRADLQAMLQQERNRLHALQARDCADTWLLEHVQAHITYLEDQLTQVQAALEEHVKAHLHLQAHVKRLRQVPGVGPKNVYLLLVLLYRFGTLTDFKGTSKAITAYVGLDPKLYASGSSLYRRPRISRQGSPFFRHQLYLGALGGVRGNNALRHFYQRLVGRGKPKKLALVAAARKLVTWAWAVFRDEADFVPALAGLSV